MHKIRFRPIVFAVIAFITLCAQASLVNLIAPAGIKPDLVLPLVLFYGLYNGSPAGMICGMILGLGVDVISSGITGLYAFIFGVIGAGAGLLQERVYREHFLTKLILCAAAGAVSALGYYVLAAQFYHLPPLWDYRRLLPGSVGYTIVSALLFFHFLEKRAIIKLPLLS